MYESIGWKCLDTRVSSKHSYTKSFIYQQNNVNKSNKLHQLIEWFGTFVDLLKDVWKYRAGKSFLTIMYLQEHSYRKLKVYQQNNVNKWNKMYQLITYFGIFLDLLKEVWKHWVRSSFFDTYVSSTTLLYEVIHLSTECCHSTHTLYIGRWGLDWVWSHVPSIGSHVFQAGIK